MSSLEVAYLYDRRLHATANQNGQNFWYAYIEEVFDQLGLPARPVAPTRKAITEALETSTSLFVGPVASPNLLPSVAGDLKKWVSRGNVLIGFACEGLDDVFGVQPAEIVRQPRDDFSINGFFDLHRTPVTADVRSYLHPGQKLLIFSDVRAVAPTSASELGRYSYANARESDHAAVTSRDLGRGAAYYFSFDVPKTVWALHQGRPVDADYDGDGYYRVSDARVIGQNEEEVMYADEILFLLQNMIARKPQPFICALPPHEGAVPNALLYWGGDDEASTRIQVEASDFMASRGLPYHINAMWRNGEFPLTRPEAEHIWENGHEISVHYDFIVGRKHPFAFTRKDVTEQAKAFERMYGRRAQCSVNHCLTWTGWAEPAKWMLANGGIGDNSHFNSACPPMNPVDRIGFSFGTAFPYHFYDDWRNGNERVDFVEEPITGYEIGYLRDATSFGTVHRAIDLAAHHRLTFDMFYHPGPMAARASCRAGIDETLSYIQRRGLRVRHMGNDELARWWHARSASSIDDAELDRGKIRFTTRTDFADGIVVKVPVGDRAPKSCRCSGKRTPAETCYEYRQNWAYVVVPAGESQVELAL